MADEPRTECVNDIGKGVSWSIQLLWKTSGAFLPPEKRPKNLSFHSPIPLETKKYTEYQFTTE
jgi:hypothetical protein